MAKFVAYTIIDSGVDGRERPRIKAAFDDEDQRDKVFDADPNKNYLRKAEEIVDPEKRVQEALNKLDGIDRLVLELPDKASDILNPTRGAVSQNVLRQPHYQ